MVIYDTKKFPPKREYWYIVSLNDFRFIKLYPVYFINRASAKRAIRENFPAIKRMRYTIISYNKLIKYNLKYQIGLGRLPKFHKYDIAQKNSTPQQLKNARTIIRRRLRRMGMLVPKKHKFFIKDKVAYRHILENTQKVANSPNTEARAFRLERRGKYVYYILMFKMRTLVKGVMWRVKAIKYNAKTKTWKKVWMGIQNSDVLIPHLISEVWALAQKQGKYEEFKQYCHANGISLYKKPKKELLQRYLQKMGK